MRRGLGRGKVYRGFRCCVDGGAEIDVSDEILSKLRCRLKLKTLLCDGEGAGEA